jgi:glutaredoxin-like protein
MDQGKGIILMGILDENVKKQITDFFSTLREPVEILFFGSNEQNCDYCEQTRLLLEEVCALSGQISFQAFDIDENPAEAARYHVDKAPGYVITARDGADIHDYGIRFAGIPAGHEFTTLIRDILMVSARDSGLKPETREFLAELQRPVQLEVFVTPTCPYCPQAVVLAHQFAFESPMVQAEMIEAMEFPDLSDEYGVSGVPHTVINAGAGELVGAAPEAYLLQKVQQVIEEET